MTGHISTNLIERYRRRELRPGEIIALDDHLMDCVACRSRLRAALLPATAVERLQVSVLNEYDRENVHPDPRQLRAFLATQLEDVDRELVESHLEFCVECQTHIVSLRQVGAEAGRIVADNRVAKLWPDWLNRDLFPRSLTLRFAGTLALLLLLVWGLGRWRSNPVRKDEVVINDPSPTLPPTPQLALALIDGDRQVTLDMAGNLGGVDSLSRAEQETIRQALSNGRVETPRMLAELKSTANSLMGEPGADASRVWAAASGSTLITPFSEVVAKDRPTLRWKSLTGAESYVVTIHDPSANYREASVSPKLKTARWMPSRPLLRGRLYTWQVTAFVNGREITAPSPDAAEAKFRILSQAEMDELAHGEQRFTGRHLSLGLLYALLGLLKEAERELQGLATDNPKEPMAKQLLRDLRRQRPK